MWVDGAREGMSERHEAVELVEDVTVENVAKSVLLAAATAALAQVAIPVPGTTVPFSLQPFGVFFAGLLLGPVWGGFAMVLYVLVGVAGAPVFANGTAGLGVVLGPTGGFLVGYVLAAALIGAVVHRGRSVRSARDRSVAAMALGVGVGLAALYAVGVPWLAAVQGFSLERAAAVMAPFVPPDVLKAALAVAAVGGGHWLLDGVE